MAEQDLKCCPQCGSAAVDFGALTASNASCKACGWSGAADRLLVIPTHDLDIEVQLGALMRDLRGILSKELGIPMLGFLMRWGFIEADPHDIAGTLDRKVFSKYLAGISAGILKAVLETRRGLAAEKGPNN